MSFMMTTVTSMMDSVSSVADTLAWTTENSASISENETSSNMNITFLFFSTIAGPPVNTTKTPSKCEEDKTAEDALNTLSVVLYSVAFILGVAGNALVIWVAGFKMKRTVNTVWFLNLAIADFIFTVFLPFSIAYTAMGFHWPFRGFLCKINGTVAFLNLYASVLFLTIISIDRCVSVVFPVWSQNYRTPGLASIIALVMWVLAVILSSPTFAFRNTAPSMKPGIIACKNDYAISGNLRNRKNFSLFQKRHEAMVVSRFVLSFLLPFMAIVFCYGVIALKIMRNRMANKSRKPFWIMTAVIVSFFLCWFPFHVFAFLEISTYNKSCALKRALKVGFPIATNLAYLNSCINPILYVLLGRDAKSQIRMSFLRVFESAFKEEASQVTRSTRNQSKSMTEADVSINLLSSTRVPMQPLQPAELKS